MFRSVASKVAWVGRTASMLFGLALVLALLFGVASSAFAANGQNFIIGNGLADTVKNIVTLPTKLTMQGTAGGPALQVDQQSTNTNASGLRVTVPRGKAPLAVNASAGKATNLNADMLDGRDSTDFAPAHYFNSNFIDHSITATNAGSAVCESGDKAVSGGYELIDPTDNVWTNRPGGDRWTVAWRSSDGSAALGGTVYVICADVA